MLSATTGVCTFLLVLAGFAFTGSGIIPPPRHTQVFLPGTQVGTVDTATPVSFCQQCHQSNVVSHRVPVQDEWAGSMMAQAARDPVFYAALAVSNKYRTTSGEFCIRCHSPMGWLAGHSEDFTGQSLAGTDFDGVQCDYCHRTGDPLNPDSTISMIANYTVPGYGNGMHAVQKYVYPKRGPFDSLSGWHTTLYDPFQKSGSFCGICHDVSNPYYATDRTQQPPYAYAPLERTYSEWVESWYATQGDSGTCQSCHMSDTSGYACLYSDDYRNHLARHDLTGGNTFVPGILRDFWNGVDTAALAFSRDRATSTLRRAAAIDVEAYKAGDSVIATVRITNLTGHKLPTGYPEGRRMWIELIARDVNGDTVFHSGKYSQDSAQLLQDPQLKVYQVLQGISDSLSAQSGVPAGMSFHFILNDSTIFDNRIPPKGFTNVAFAQRNASPVGVSYPDGQYWDDTRFTLPSSATSVTATLYYQTISREYIAFLLNENASNTFDWNSWGAKLYSSWQNRGKSNPVAMASEDATVSITGIAGGPKTIPLTTELLQNFPNPFNPVTTLTFRLAHAAHVQLELYDMLGQKVMTLLNDDREPGIFRISLDGSKLASGIYLCTFQAGTVHQTRKLAIIK